MIIYKDCIEFNIIGEILFIYINETSHGISRVVEIDKKFYHLPDSTSIYTNVILQWEKLRDIKLTGKEIDDLMKDNKI